MGLSNVLAKYIESTTYEEIPSHVIEFTKLCILDWLGSAVAGHGKQPIQIIHELIEDLGSKPQSTLVTGGKSSVTHAALVNGAASHIVELDDIHKSSIIHAATVVIPAAIAVAEWKRKSGKDLITAVVVGYEVCYRIGEAVSPSHYYYWHNTATCGTFGAAAAVSKLLNLNEEQIVSALGSAGTQAAGLWEFIEDTAMTKQLHPGKAAMNGVISALLAEKGFTAAKQILEGKRGFFNAMSENYDAHKITTNLGEVHKIIENSIKVHASCRHTHSTMDLAIELSRENALTVDDVEKIKVGTYQVALNITDNPHPTTVYASKFSLQFCTALAFVKGHGGLFDFNEETLHDPVIRALMDKVTVEVEESIHNAYPTEWGSIVQIRLKDGRVIEKQTNYPKGDLENPVSKEEMVAKFEELASELPNETVKTYTDRVLRLEELPSVHTLLVLEETMEAGYETIN
ncbi:MmgE/PrpD family protein [Ammoniphilus sp. 3BR4]|uniref:MmgE/PrpD family protein n=1 Tax=Ammoniphilus sp. 3BR4 TaxID=3158265 RepID=UPI0034672ED8